ncbi:MAG: hypothetical protein FWD90_00210 [Defluviitaleaceae bacterium]|nr:hypothetical protein [Defluviitaleaceae bacterium]
MKYVWFNAKDTSRSPYAAFRKDFYINDASSIKKAVFNVFADTVYALYVNGAFVGFGPVRFDPRFPQYDTYDLTELLQNGKNALAVLVNFHGHKVFKSIPAQAAMIAWGTVEYGGEVIDLSTGNGAAPWKCKQHLSYTRYTPKLSFALDTQAFYDQKQFDEGWTQTDYDDSDWPDAVVCDDQHAFGPLTPREIPFMALTPVAPASVYITPLRKTERLYSFGYAPPIGYDTAFDEQKGYDRTLYWTVRIHSPRAQTVTAGVLYEELWLNGEPCRMLQDPFKPLRFNAALALNEGDNQLFARVGLSGDIYEGYLALPGDCGLVLQPFRYLPLQTHEAAKNLRASSLPFPEDFDGWFTADPASPAQSPCREVSWDDYAPMTETLLPDGLNGFTVRKDSYPDDFALTIKMETMRLVFPRVSLSGLEGATIDFLYGDRLHEDGRHIRSLSWVPLGDRAVCARDTFEWQPIQPRGFKYLSITVRNTKRDILINKIDFLNAQYPVKRVGTFECSDPLLNRIWEMGAVTQAIDMEDAYVDCVDRERGLYALDALIQYKVNLACFGDHALMKRTLELYGQSNHPIGLFRCLYPNTGDYVLPDFCLYIVNAFYAYFKQTRDIDFIAKHWPAITQNLNVFHRLSDERADKLLCADKPEGDWPRNPQDNRTGFLGDGERTDNTGINCLFSCLYLTTLRETSEMADAVISGDSTEINHLPHRISVLTESIKNTFWNEEKGLFVDNTEHKRFSPHASLAAVCAGAVTDEIRERLRITLPPLLTPFFKNGYDHTEGTLFETSSGYYFINGLYKLGLGNEAERIIKEGWGYFLTRGLTTTPEHFDMVHSQCHAWAAHPTYFLSRYVLGMDADADTVNFDPQPGSVTWAKGTFPHPKGLIEVEWHMENGRVVCDRCVVV